ncbi:MAG: alpha/beta fold hydrolase [Pseudomonadales bacterium]|jgi:pimeloyl-ACP methyl ester carboxylesterase|nr:alpha/beta fold hydrolase [Pseudomonadales bacterium]MDP6471891.1 alpha/beta fold hydrolase [Pseudomonadales bacterium]MDP6826839.1 alpha/beta fold hydrolase [Pseudomonadales bacterium]MDP6970883.1 alpha/beta fold hydrolase [Pseudomonadales bacterium]|tara:strand:- start:861 stop:1946 length:1086 start_codon:yes stop_codon:yes gene_type:complete
MLWIKRLILVLLVLVVGTVAVMWLGAWASLDHDRSHTAHTAGLPLFAPNQPDGLVRIGTGALEFRARVAGFRTPQPKGNVVLLHGFPETSVMWTPLINTLATAGYRVVAFDQRGYSPGARPESVSDYQIAHLMQDVLDVAEHVGFDTFHLVGHDWGAGVGWGMAMHHAERLESWTSLSIPHLAAFGEAIANDAEQQSKSSYMLLFRTPLLPEILLTFNGLSLLKTLYAEHATAVREEYVTVFREPGALTAALNWYRAAALEDSEADPVVRLPVLFIWGNKDPAVGRSAVAAQGRYLDGPFTEVELDAGHWLMESHADLIGASILRHLDALYLGIPLLTSVRRSECDAPVSFWPRCWRRSVL